LCDVRSSVFLILAENCSVHHFFSGCEIGKNEMDGVCSTNCGEERHIQDFGEET